MLFSCIWVGAEVVVVVLALEILMDADHLVHVFSHIRLDHFGGNCAMVCHRDCFTNVVHE